MVEGSYPQNLAWIHAAVSEKLEFMDDGWTTDAYAMTVTLLTKSSRAKNLTQCVINLGKVFSKYESSMNNC